MTREFDRASKAILITGLLSLLVAAYFVRPIARLNGVAERFGKGDLKVRVAPSLLKRKDELGDLGRTFNQMAGRIDTLVSGYKSFLAHASHELGSPLTRLNIALALARAKAGRALESEHERSSKEADRLNNLVQEMLLLARLESGNELSRTPEIFELSSIVEEAFQNASFEAEQMKKSISMTGSEQRFAKGHPDLMLRAIDNVLRNGLRFATKQVRVHVRYAGGTDTSAAVILIEDDGPGIPAGTEEAIFQPFFTLSETDFSEITRGAGLGLAIAKQAAITCGGTIRANPSSIGGLAVVIQIPVASKDR